MTRPVSLLRIGCILFGGAGLLSLGFVGFTQTAPPHAVKATPEQATFFETKVRPVLADNCFSCHGPQKHEGGLRLDSSAAFAKGGDSGALLVPGDPDKSLLIQAIRQTGDLKMPEGGKLAPADIANLVAWVKMGAPWPEETGAAVTKTEALWSLQPVVKPAMPKVLNKAWVLSPVDSFVLAKLEAAHQKPAASADRRTLIRRVTYDLTGLPPTPEEVDAFVADKAPDAYAKVVDRLLDSPHYGERWARHWMDVARYSDTKGYVFNEDRNYYNAYTYRDWLINAFNSDMPYDQFVTDQLAADRLPGAVSGDDRHNLAALGFLTIGRRFLNSDPDIIDDRIDVTMRGFEGLTVACARCHDHKFDPIPTQDYYSLYAVFNSSQEATIPLSSKVDTEPWEHSNEQIDSTEKSIREIVLNQVNRLRQPDLKKTLDAEQMSALQATAVNAIPEGDRLRKLEKSFEPKQLDNLHGQQRELDDLRKNAPPAPAMAMAMQDKEHPHDGVIFKRGNPGNPGDPAPRRFLLALSNPSVERAHWTSDSGRLELAQAIVAKSNPLTARVFVNRVWQDHFGAGIVRTPSDFGHQGEKPTDPKLLDYLAASFMENGWSIKKLQRMIVMSNTYKQSSDVTPAMVNADPDNRNWGRQNRRRLDMEEMRDALMMAAGKLDLKDVGGKSTDLWSEPFTQRRAVYGFIERQNLPGIFHTFDFATPDSTSPRRFVTTVPQQALFFMNSPFSVEEAQALIQRPEIAQAKDDGQRVRRLYRILFDRLPNAEETKLAMAYMKGGSDATVAQPESGWQYGYGGFDTIQQRTTSFFPFTSFVNGQYQAGQKIPDPQLGYVSLRKDGGHPGHDAEHCAIRRWTAPADMTIQISGELHHPAAQGDGVCARVVSNRQGVLGTWVVHNKRMHSLIASVTVTKGETLDFSVDPQASDAYDSFVWDPQIRSVDGKQGWDAAADFGPPPGPALTRLTLYAQALLMTNEFMFID